MSGLVENYSSEEEQDTQVSPSEDAFGITAIPASKKARLAENGPSTMRGSIAPDVLAEVRFNKSLYHEFTYECKIRTH